MAVRFFNFVSVSAVLGILLLFTTLWNLQSRDILYPDVKGSAANSGERAKAKPPDHLEEATAEEDFDSVPQSRPSFLDIATKWGTDKVSDHHYEHMYQKYLQPIRDEPLKMLEIGLGCNMGYGPGKSYYTWLEFLPNVDLYYIESDKACVEAWAKNMTDVKIFTGDQGSVTFLNSFIASSGGGFDIIIDDGGHTMEQQMTSFKTLFPVVKPGGIYFCEDLGTSYGGEEWGSAPGKKTMMMMIGELLHDLNVDIPGAPKMVNEVARDMSSLECGREICAFFKKDLGKTEIRLG